jgi:carbon storage regulator
MLVLTRKVLQTIQIGDDITISVLQVKGRAVRLGISAPDEVRVARGELVAANDGPQSPAEPDGTDDGKPQDEPPQVQLPDDRFRAQRRPTTEAVNRTLALRRRIGREAVSARQAALIPG